ncbi:glycosyltransferase [Epidermidibacterium keratini]|uniref:Glycosyltransferase n=1 Tax=Epidermidibacterium keratini TaxID=1891644 RepID=A0A7L4YM46_9ACTN|nr:glycosyltransferase family 2 protein [Epidermidibacterium keratini]QHC00148.1 glycosyltransferase [Epidermidibacterium keratini]
MRERILAVVVVNYGSSDLLSSNLVATHEAASDATIIVVDNRSTDAERQRLTTLSRAHGWHLVAMDDNAGFGAGANAGAAEALSRGATDLLVLNPDARIDRRSIELLSSATADGWTVAAPVVTDPHGHIWFAGSDLYLDDGATRGRRRRTEHPGARLMEWLSGACLWIPRAVWEQVDGFADDYFLYWEDVDFSRRALDAGARLVVVEDARAIHDEGATHRAQGQRPEAKSALYYYFNIRNRMLFAAAHLEPSDLRRWQRTAPANAWQVLLRGGRRQFVQRPGVLAAAARGLRDGRRIAHAAQPKARR